MNTGRRRVRQDRSRPRPATRRRSNDADTECSASNVFDVLWKAMADLIGPTATAALLQRSLKHAAAAAPELREVVIARDQFVYTYRLPASWSHTAAGATASLKHMVRSLWPLLADLTGSVIVRRLQQDPLLGRCGVIPEDQQ